MEDWKTNVIMTQLTLNFLLGLLAMDMAIFYNGGYQSNGLYFCFSIGISRSGHAKK